MPPKPAPIFAQPSTVIPSHPNHQHDIVTALVAAETLDTLPGDLTKTFADLRELDAVLNSTTSSLTHKLRTLTAALQGIHPGVASGSAALLSPPGDPSAIPDRLANGNGNAHSVSSPSPPLARFQLLLEIAEELTRYKIGVEDKVRVSGQACDTLVAHQAHLQALLANSSIFLSPQSSTGDALDPWDGPTAGKRARLSPTSMRIGGMPLAHGGSDFDGAHMRNTTAAAAASVAGEVTPSKKRKTGKEKVSVVSGETWDDGELAGHRRSPAPAKKAVSGSLAGHAAKDGRSIAKKRSRNSPADSLHGSPAPGGAADSAYADTGYVERLHGASQASGTAHESHKSGSNRLHAHGMRTSGDTASAALDAKANGQKHSSAGTPAKRISDLSSSTKRVASPSAHGPERSLHKSNGRRGSSIAQADPRLDRGQPSISDQDMTEADPDPTPYCYCQKQSYGEMIGCDSDDCRYEWFHLSCLDLSKPPDGTWLCPECEAREQKEKRSRSKRGGASGKGIKKRM